MVIDHILISASPGETRVAVLAANRLVEVLVERVGAASLVGNIYLGRVETVNKGLDAAFVNIGGGRDGFLALPEARLLGGPAVGGSGSGHDDAIGDFLNEGDAALVQVQRDPVEGKGAKLTAHINLAGADLVFRPLQPGVSISRRIEGAGDRDRLAALVEGLLPKDADDGGFIVRTAARDVGEDSLKADAERLIERWRDIRHARANAKAPALLYAGPGPGCRALRDFGGPGIRKIVVDGAPALAEVNAFCQAEAPDLAALIEHHSGPQSLFEAFDVEQQIDAALSPVVTLGGGGSLIISRTAALCAIDVNTGGADGGTRQRTAAAVNLDAATEVARQIRLRNISGLIVVDFVSVRDEGSKRETLEALKQACATDPVGPHVVGYTRMGLVEMTRPRHGLSLGELLGTAWDSSALTPAKSPLTHALAALRAVVGHGKGTAQVTLRASVAVIDALKDINGPGPAALKQTEDRLGLAILLVADQDFAAPGYDLDFGKAE
ncbi:MAG: Rne/Rng family ribonuclease [Proteobacteria bacterium]|nr:Rne/Rng family ribonuclease [Pseudomonadota bacterium]